MTHAQLIAALFPDGPPADYKDHALLLTLENVLAMQAAQDAVASDRHKVQPVATTDGRFFIGADILGELAPGGIFAPAMAHFDGSKLAGIEVVPWAVGVALLPRPVDINHADSAALQSLDGVSSARADAIIAGRPWADPADLSGINGISAAMVAAWLIAPGLVAGAVVSDDVK